MRENFAMLLAQLNEELTHMGGLIESAIANAVKALDGDEKAEKKAAEYEKDINRAERDIENLCYKLLLTQQPVARDLRTISSALKMITDMERIGDQAEDIVEIAVSVKNRGYLEKSKNIHRMATATIDMVNKSVESFVRDDMNIADEVIAADDVVDGLFDDVMNDLTQAIKDDHAPSEVFDILLVAKYFERIGDHAENIAEWVKFSKTGEH